MTCYCYKNGENLNLISNYLKFLELNDMEIKIIKNSKILKEFKFPSEDIDNKENKIKPIEKCKTFINI